MASLAEGWYQLLSKENVLEPVLLDIIWNKSHRSRHKYVRVTLTASVTHPDEHNYGCLEVKMNGRYEEVYRHIFTTRGPFPKRSVRVKHQFLTTSTIFSRLIHYQLRFGSRVLTFGSGSVIVSAASFVPFAFLEHTTTSYDSSLRVLDAWNPFAPHKDPVLNVINDAFVNTAHRLLQHMTEEAKCPLWKVHGTPKATHRHAYPSSKAPRSHLDGAVRQYTDGLFASPPAAFEINSKVTYRCVVDGLIASHVIRQSGIENEVTFVSPHVIEDDY
jgi:hypothetical protein